VFIVSKDKEKFRKTGIKILHFYSTFTGISDRFYSRNPLADLELELD
jgi:hypothetical protein